jgi:tripartite-type tricarboxylate transporter receptor subunit TctC
MPRSIPRRRALAGGALLAAAAAAVPAFALEADQALRIMVPQPPGGATDVLARLLSEPLGGVSIFSSSPNLCPSLPCDPWRDFARIAPAADAPFVGPAAGVPAPVVERLDAAIRAVVDSPAVSRRLREAVLEPLSGTAADLQQRARADSEAMAAFIRRRRGIKVE